VPIISGLINSIPHTVTLYPPEEIQIGRYKNDRIPIAKEVADKYRQIKNRLINQQVKQVKPSAGPFPKEILEKGTAVWLHTTGSPVEAVILKDFGAICLVKKVKDGRFRIVKVHKSNISIRQLKNIYK